ncbi:MAG TPA: AmmeMemoRadiSam system protein A [Candidatus Polarisedimenticolaceae bacterium]|nr:AmmeMemoRadiSam system protein A [Candidatus Polarisedimenticolaceae bacterium]
MTADSAPLRDDERRALLRLARTAIEDRLLADHRLDRAIAEVDVTPTLARPAGLFVTITDTRDRARPLRGCVGTMRGSKPLYLEVAETARAAAFDDPRFPPLACDELPRVRLAISILSALRPAPDWRAIRPGIDGVQLVREAKRAVFLPQIAVAQRWDREQLLTQLALKAGLAADGWRSAELFVFRTDSFEEPDAAHSGG